MFKTLNDLEKSMYSIMLSLKNSKDPHTLLNSLDSDTSIALHHCTRNEYIENLDEYQDANGNYHFISLGNIYITQKGLTFIRDMSPLYRFKNSLFGLLRGTLGFLLGILSTIIAEYIVWIITSSGK